MNANGLRFLMLSALAVFISLRAVCQTAFPEVLDKGTVVVGGIKGNEIEQAIELAIAIKENNEPSALIPDYTDLNVSIKVIKIIQSFTGIINKVIWGK